MEFRDFLAHLDADYRRLREALADHLADAVPTCPGWTGDDLARHVAEVYLHKTECIRLGAFPRPWPPDLSAEPTLAVLDRAYAGLTAQFAAQPPQAPAATWYESDQTVGFWIRRMSQETLIHRIDAELTAGVPVAPLDSRLAEDGVDEVLTCFLAYGSHRWQEDFTTSLPGTAQPPVLVSTGERGWLVRATPDGVGIEPAGADQPAPATVAGPPAALLRWLWNRGDDDGAVRIDGDPALVTGLRALLTDATQ